MKFNKHCNNFVKEKTLYKSENNYPIRILCVMSTLDRGGAESMCMNLYRHIDRMKVQFDFVKHGHKVGMFEDEIKQLGGRIFEAPRYKIYNTLQYKEWWRQHLQTHPEHQVIHGHFFTISPIYFSVAQKMHRKTIGHIHASSSDGFLKTQLEKRISTFTDYPLACSQQAGEWIYKDRPFTVLHNALDTSLFKYNENIRGNYRKCFGLSDVFALGTVANLSPVKNPMGLLDIFLNVRKVIPNTKLIWIGEGGQRKAIEERIHTENIEDSVMLLGTRDDVPNLLQAMDAFLLPSFNEGLPLSVIEAQASGLPCLISDKVTKEADITGLCHFLPIEEPAIWTEELSKIIVPRRDTSKEIMEAGYDIQSTSKWLEDFYVRIEKEQGVSA